MARPRKTETRLPVTIRLNPDLIARIDATEAKTRTELIERAVNAYLDANPARTQATKEALDTAYREEVLTGKKTTVADLRAKLDAKIQPACTHPRASRIVTSMGYATCGNCNTRLS